MTLVNKEGVTVTTENKDLIASFKKSGFSEKKPAVPGGQNPNGQNPNTLNR